jgi:hypothetical protein
MSFGDRGERGFSNSAETGAAVAVSRGLGDELKGSFTVIRCKADGALLRGEDGFCVSFLLVCVPFLHLFSGSASVSKVRLQS